MGSYALVSYRRSGMKNAQTLLRKNTAPSSRKLTPNENCVAMKPIATGVAPEQKCPPVI